MKRKLYNELGFTDDYMFCKILSSNLDLCKELLELILGVEIKSVQLSESQREMRETYTGKGIRLDVYVLGEDNVVYDIEMQTTISKELPKRMRYYQGMIDIHLIERGDPYSKLKKSYIIFICTEDTFGKGLPKYTFRNICEQDNSVVLDDEAEKIIINAGGNREGLSDNMKDFLDFIEGKGATNSFTRRLQEQVDTAIKEDKWEVEYMTYIQTINLERAEAREEGFEEGRAEGRAVGREEGRAEGRAEGQRSLIESMLRKGKTPDEISDFCDYPLQLVKEIEKSMR